MRDLGLTNKKNCPIMQLNVRYPILSKFPPPTGEFVDGTENSIYEQICELHYKMTKYFPSNYFRHWKRKNSG